MMIQCVLLLYPSPFSLIINKVLLKELVIGVDEFIAVRWFRDQGAIFLLQSCRTNIRNITHWLSGGFW